MRASHLGFVLALATIGLAAVPPARAETWCADPLWVHEWGVQVFGADGRARAPIAMPSYFHRRGPEGAARSVVRVRDLPPDGGERALPIVHFYSAGSWSDQPIPVALSVGFTHGEATAWYPQVDVRRPAAQANTPAARAGRDRVLAQRAALANPRDVARVDGDPTRQLEWQRLELTREARHTPAASSGWARDLRALDALWVNGASESERFVFYEATTSERAALTIARGDRFGPERRHYVFTNASAQPVHDVFVVHREASGVFVLFAPSIPAGRSAGFVLEEHRVTPASLAAATRERLRQGLVDPREPAPPASYRWGSGNCVMQRDPAQPVETAEGHGLYAHEVDAILRVWGARMFDQQGTTIVYREDARYLDAVMPLSVYTDMYHFPLVRRAGLALEEGVALP